MFSALLGIEKRGGADLGKRCWGEQSLGGVEPVETVVSMYYMKEEYINEKEIKI